MSYASRFHMISSDELQQHMLNSARNVFSVMADIALEEYHEGPGKQQENCVTALIGFAGTYQGVVALRCPEPLARRIATGLLYVAGEVNTQDVFAAMGEVANIIGGDIKLYLDRGGRHVRLSSPSVFAGNEVFLNEFLAGSNTVAFTMAAGDERLLFGVQISSGE